jgi:glycosyltransferase involved in cell wall biosynthesis
MRITFLTNQGLEDASSLGRHFPLAKELVKVGHQVKLLAAHPAFGGLAERHFWRDGVEVFYVGQMHVHKSGSRKRYLSPGELLRTTLQTTSRMSRLAARIPTDAFQVCKAQPINGLAALLARSVQRRPLYLDSDDYEIEFNRFSAGWQKAVVGGFERALPRRARAVTTHTRFNVERNVSYGVPRAKVLYVPNGIDRERFAGAHEMDARALRSQLGIDAGKVVVYVGNLSLTNHPIDLLLKAFARVPEREPAACLLMVGGGEDFERVRALAVQLGLGDQVRFVGRVRPGLVPAYLAIADVSVEPVHDDLVARARSPLKVFESMAVGTPVVAGDVGDRREVLGTAGLLVAPGDVDALADGLLSVLQDAALRARMSEAARVRSEQYYWDVLVHQFARVYEL